MTGESTNSGASVAPARSRWQRYGTWALGALLVLDLVALLFALSFAHVTAEGPAKRGLRYSLAITFEIDSYVDGHYEPLRQQAAGTDQPVTLPELPLDIAVAPDELLATDREGFRALVLDRAAGIVHAEGAAALRQDGGSGTTLADPQDAVAAGMDFLRPRPHSALMRATIALAAVAGLLAAWLWFSLRSYAWFAAIGLSAVLAAVPFLLLAVAVRYGFRVAADGVDDYVVREFVTLGQELTWAAIRNGMIFAVGGATTLVAGSVLSTLVGARRN